MDNEGLYVTYEELIAELYQGSASQVTASDLTLSNKVVDAGGDIYDFTPASPAPAIGDIVYAGGATAEIKALPAAGKIQINKTGVANKIPLGIVKLLKAPLVGKEAGENYIKDAMDYIDEQTGQFFNKRNGEFQLEGNNSPVLFFPVPIIEIEELIINSLDQELLEGEDKDFVAFKGRQMPQDDRRNPKIKLNVGRGRDSIFVGVTGRVFAKNTLTHITGSFGFLEADGSTPRLIKRATKILAIGKLNQPIVKTAGVGDVGPVKKIKVDLHEKEFFEPTSNKEVGSQVLSGSEEVDIILAKYRTPIRISGSFLRSPYEGNELDV